MKKFHIEGSMGEYTIDGVTEYLYDDVSEFEDADSFNDLLNEEHGSMVIGGRTFYASDILYTMNEDLYYEMLSEEASYRRDEEMDEATSTLENMELDDIEIINGVRVICVFDDEDEDKTEEGFHEFNIEEILAI